MRSAWILSAFWDSVLFIGAPLVCMAAFLPLRTHFSSQQIAVLLLAFFTFGHHLPGFLRAYGDRELFARYRLRFLLAPPLILGSALLFDTQNLHGLLLIVSAWDIWHVLMQHYGFMRIYDAKAGAVSPWSPRLDRAVSISWYFTLIATSPHYRHNLLSRAYQTGLPLVPLPVMNALETTMLAATAVITSVYIGYHLNLWRQGRPVSLRKLILLAIFLGSTYYLYVYIDDFLVGFTVWSAFHCIQYYGIVWAFNRNRVARNSPVRSFVRFLFRPQVLLVILYAALILAYGSINFLVGLVSDAGVRRFLMAFVFTSNALHYYYDGFIWKVREPETRRYLDIAPATPSPASVVRVVRWLRPSAGGWVQAAYLVAIPLVLAGFERRSPHQDLAVQESLVELAPGVGGAQYNLGNALWKQGRLDEALGAYRRAERLMPGSPWVQNNLGGVLYDKGLLDEAISHYQRALALGESNAEQGLTTSNSPLAPAAASGRVGGLFITYNNLADALARRGRPEEALPLYRRALELDGNSARAHANLGAALAQLGRYGEGRQELERALSIDPHYTSAHMNLGSVLAYLGETGQAVQHYEIALRSGDERARRAAQVAIGQLRSARRE